MNKIRKCDSLYPDLLKEIYNPPEQIYLKGDASVLQKTCISFVGTRNCSTYGATVCRKLIREISCYDLCIVSGLALGIDTVAHDSAIKCGLTTVAVLGSGIENIYPRQNLPLARRIVENGAIISEHEGSLDIKQFHFPLRNRIISGLCAATVIIEAPERSGALITAKLALEQGREVYVVPGDIDREGSKGLLKLLQKSCAFPVASGFDILNELKNLPNIDLKGKYDQGKEKKVSVLACEKIENRKLILNEEEKKVVSGLSAFRGKTIEQIIRKSDFELNKILALLSLLEIRGIVQSKNGKFFLSKFV